MRRRLTTLDTKLAPWSRCATCALANCRSKVVNYRGSSRATILLIGDAPGTREDKIGESVVGPTARVLDRAIKAAGVDPASVLMTTLVACKTPEQREPTVAEIYACRHRLEVLHLTVPTRRVVLLGALATKVLYQTDRLGRGFVDLNRVKTPARSAPHPREPLSVSLDVGSRLVGQLVEALRWAGSEPKRGLRQHG